MKLIAYFLGITLILSSLYVAQKPNGLPFVPSAPTTSAASVELKGYAYSENIGWISFNCSTTPTGCDGSSDYKVILDTVTNNLTGFAWSENIGWIEFGGSAVSDCPAGTCQARREGNELSGWARAVNRDIGGAQNFPGGSTITTAGTQSFSVPAGVTTINVKSWGAGGGSAGGGTGGGGGFAEANVAVTPGETITLDVGAGGLITGTAGGNTAFKRGAVDLVRGGGGGAGNGSVGAGGVGYVSTTGTTLNGSGATPGGTGISGYVGGVGTGATAGAPSSGSTTYAVGGSSNTYVVPAGVTALTVKAWGGGGGAGGGNQMGATYRRGGGGGYATMASIPVTPGESLTVRVAAGGGGGNGSNCSGMPGGTGGTPGGGNGGTPGGGFVCPTASGGGGGGYTGVFRGAITQANALLIAGGGAGGGGASAGYAAGSGGAGGGASGVSGGGAGGTQTSGAAALQGSAGGGGRSFGGGGGGGGYFGGVGGGGADNANSAGGGGGSGRLSGTGTLTAGSGVTPANVAEPEYQAGVGVGAAPGAAFAGNSGGPGLASISYTAYPGGAGGNGQMILSYTAVIPNPVNGSDGWISLNSLNGGGGDYQVEVGVSELSGFAWGSDVVGWISFNCTNETVNPCADSNYKVYFDAPCDPPSYQCINGNTESQYTDPWCAVTTTTCNSGEMCRADMGSICGPGNPTGQLVLSSQRVRKGNTIAISWPTLAAYDQCRLSGTPSSGASDPWTWSSTTPLANVTTPAIQNEVTFKLECTQIGDASATYQLLDTERVTLLPSIKEI